MEPETVHLIAQMIRHDRGFCTSLQRWIESQPPSRSLEELRQVIEARRGMLAVCERQLAAHGQMVSG